MTSAHRSSIDIVRFDHIQMEVGDLEESLDFYGKIFGFTLREVGLRQLVRWAIVGNQHKLYLCMHEYPESRGKKNEGLEITHFGLIVDDFDAVNACLKSYNVTMPDGDMIQYHSSRSIYFRDPNGYKIEISERNGGGIDG